MNWVAAYLALSAVAGVAWAVGMTMCRRKVRRHKGPW